MDPELDELDDWVGTLAELQLGLERKCPSSASNRLPHKSSYSGPIHLTRVSPTHSAPGSYPWTVAQILDSSSPPALPPRRDHLHPPDRNTPPHPSSCNEENVAASGSLTHSIRTSFNPPSCKEATAENDLNCLLRQLEEVENTMRVLEQDDGFTRRYSLASSSTTEPSSGCNSSPAPDAPQQQPPPQHRDSVISTAVTGVNGDAGSSLEPQGTLQAHSRTDMPLRSADNADLRPPSLRSTDYEIADDAPDLMMANRGVRGPAGFRQTPVIHNGGLENACSPPRSPHDGLPPGTTADAPPHPVGRNPVRQSTSSSSQPLSAAETPSSGRSSAAPHSPLLQSPSPSKKTNGALSRLSQDGSTSEKSVSDGTEVATKLNKVVDLADRLQLNKLVVRIFRPDKTTKAILMDQRMTAGEVASMLIEKNFLSPAINLCLVEKVPSLKVERVFEESENVAECILAWPTKSQNMIFFETRDDHFGFLESPKDWLGESFANNHGFHSSESVHKLFEGLSAVDVSEYHEFLYIRKPGEKTWTRRMCVLRNSGLYTTKKNKKTFSASDLIRLLVLDEQLHVYTTTGGWSKMRAPTPHGFALKTYAAQEFNSTHVFCFCAPDDTSLKQWVCRLRLAKYGENLLRDYERARQRIAGCESRNAETAETRQSLVRKTSLDCPRPATAQQSFATPQLLNRRQASTGNLHRVNPLAAQADANKRTVSLCQQATTPALRQIQQQQHLLNGCPSPRVSNGPQLPYYVR